MSAAEMDQISSSSTVARFIQRFREAIPQSPGRRRRDRPAMEKEFWWTRSSEYKDFQTDDDLTIEQTTSPKKQADEDLVARPRAALTPEELRSLDTKEDEPYGEASYQSIPKPHPPHEMDSGECSRVLNQTAIWASPISPSSSGPPDPPVSENPEELTSQSITEAETVARVADQHVIGAEKERFVNCSAAEADEAQGDPLADLDERASTLLEQCRQLLAAPSANSGQATNAMLGTIACGLPESAFGDRVDGLSNLSREELEQRAWMLLGTSDRLDQGTSPGTVRETLHSRANSLVHAAGSFYGGHRQGEHPAWDCRLTADGQIGSARDKGNMGADYSPDNGNGCRAWIPGLENGALDHRGRSESPKLHVGNGHVLDLPLFGTELSGNVLAEGRRAAHIQREYGATLVSDIGRLDVRHLDSAGVEDSSARVPSAVDRLSFGEGHIERDCVDPAHAANVAVSDEHMRLECASSAQTRDVPASFTLAREPGDDSVNKSTASGLENTRSATPLEMPWGQGASSVASLEEFAEDPVVAALLQRAIRIEEELKKRRSLRP